jgi:hypothetical protein
MNGQVSQLLGAGAGIAAAILIFLSLAAVDPLREATDDELLEWWSSNSNLDDSIASMYLRLAAIPFLLIFVAQLRSTLRAGDAIWADVASSSGVVCAGMLAVSALFRGSIAQSVRMNDELLPGVDTLRLTTNLGYEAYGTLFVLSLAVVVAATAAAVILGRVGLPRWLSWVSIPVAVISLATVAFQAGAFASPLLLLWLVATSICIAAKQTKTTPKQVAVAAAAS